MSISLTFSELSAAQAEALLALYHNGADAPAAAAEPAKPRGRPRKDAAEAAPAPAAPEAPAAAPAAAGPSQADVRALLQEVVKVIGRDKCSALCLEHGAPNLGAIDPSKYASLADKAKAALTAAKSNPEV